MSKLLVKPKVSIAVIFEVDESEARALDALAGYGDDAFIKVFYEKLGEGYMREHEKGLRSFLTSIRGIVGPALSEVDDARALLIEKAKGRLNPSA